MFDKIFDVLNSHSKYEKNPSKAAMFPDNAEQWMKTIHEGQKYILSLKIIHTDGKDSKLIHTLSERVGPTVCLQFRYEITYFKLEAYLPVTPPSYPLHILVGGGEGGVNF